MKKTLLFTMVFGIASLANAGLTFDAPATVVEGTEFQIIFSGTVADAPMGAVLWQIGNPATLVSWTIESAAGNLSNFAAYPSYGGFELVAQGEGVQDGVWFTVNMLAGPAGTQMDLELWDSISATTIEPSYIIIDFIPEPMTLSLLALGGLLLRKRK